MCRDELRIRQLTLQPRNQSGVVAHAGSSILLALRVEAVDIGKHQRTPITSSAQRSRDQKLLDGLLAGRSIAVAVQVGN